MKKAGFYCKSAAKFVLDNFPYLFAFAVVPAICVMPDYDMLLENDWAPYYPGIRTLPQNLEQLADWIRGYAKENGWLCLDFAREFLKYTADRYQRYFSDGIHPNERGHAIMARIARPLLYPRAD